MSGSSPFFPQDRKAWLLAIGRQLRAEYAAAEEPIPKRLAGLISKLEGTVQAGDASESARRDDDRQSQSATPAGKEKPRW